MTSPVVLVVPCYNEAARLNGDAVLKLLDDADVRLLLVDDGSTDPTKNRLDELAARAPDRVDVLALGENRGKGEAVRVGMARGLRDGARAVGFLDADLSTPPREMLRVLHALDDERIDVALGSRVQLLGRHVERRASRHYVGRVFGTAASLLLDAPIYDTQCGAKAFRKTPTLEAALRAPFVSRWAFDVELLGRLRFGFDGAPPLPLSSFLEVPLLEWRDVKGSHLNAAAMLHAAADLAKIAARLKARG